MSNYTKTTDFGAKDSLPTGDSGKIIRGTEFETEFDAISTAIATKADIAGPTFTGTLTYETISDGTISITAFVDEDDMSSNSANLVPTQQSVKAYVDAVTTELQAQDLDFQADSGGALSIDLDTETMTFTGGTGIDTTGSGNDVSFAIDSTVATLTGTQTLTNKTLTSPDVNTPDIDGGTIDGTVIGGTTPAAVSATTVSATGNITVGGTVDGRDVATDGTKLDGIESGATADQTAAEIRTLVESATDSNVFTDADHTKLDGIEAGATGDQTNAEIRAAVEAATDSNVFTDADHSKLDGIEAGADVTDTTNVTAAGAVMDSELTNETAVKSLDQGVATTDTPTFAGLATSANVTFGDNDKAIFGAGSDLQIYHDGSHSYVKDAGTGILYVQGSGQVRVGGADGTTGVEVNESGDVKLRYNNANKLATTSTGIDVTGTAVTDGLTVAGATTLTHSGTTLSVDRTGGATALIELQQASTVRGYLGADSTKSLIVFNGSAAEKFSVSNAGIDVTGSVTADGLTVDGAATIGSSTAKTKFYSDSTYNGIYNGSSLTSDESIYMGADTMFFYASGKKRLDINAGGDVSFYEDTGTTAKFFWDASAERLGLGTSSPAATLHVDNGSGSALYVGLANNIYYRGSEHIWQSQNNTAERMRIDSNGRVGIGTTPVRVLDIATTTGGTIIHLTDDATGHTATDGVDLQQEGTLFQILNREAGDIRFGTDNTERMRVTSAGQTQVVGYDAMTLGFPAVAGGASRSGIKPTVTGAGDGQLQFLVGGNNVTEATTVGAMIDASGTLLVGTTDSDPSNNSANSSADNGIASFASGEFVSTAYKASANTGSVGYFNRTGTDGAVLEFRKSGTAVGSIGTANGNAFILSNDVGLTFAGGNDAIFPTTSAGAYRDAAIDLGGSSQRFKDLYLSGGVSTNTATGLSITADSSNRGILNLSTSQSYQLIGGSHYGYTGYKTGGYHRWFGSDGSEDMRLDSSGNLLVGKTSTNIAVDGCRFGSFGAILTRGDGAEPLRVNRTSSDGDVIKIDMDGATVGAISTYGSGILIGNAASSAYANIRFTDNEVFPCTTTGGSNDDAIDLGKSNSRYRDIYAGNGTIQTSDRNEKQDIEELSDAEQRVAVACKGLLRKFRWINSVADKGDDARIHFGIIAQDLQAAFEAEGLDAGRYGMFINSTWTDEETGEERSRMGVRYSELLAFIIAAI